MRWRDGASLPAKRPRRSAHSSPLLMYCRVRGRVGVRGRTCRAGNTHGASLDPIPEAGYSAARTSTTRSTQIAFFSPGLPWEKPGPSNLM